MTYNFIDRTGEKHITNEGYEIEIIEYKNNKNLSIKLPNDIIIKSGSYSCIEKGTFKNPYHPSVLGIGYLGIGEFLTSTKGEHSLMYTKWTNMLERCYDIRHHKRKPTYASCQMSDDWKCFQNYAKWHSENFDPEIMKGWGLDKDILIKGNKIYSAETCCFVPQEINNLFCKSNKIRGNLPVGICLFKGTIVAKMSIKNKNIQIGTFDTVEEAFAKYKEKKENYIKVIAEKWKGQISDKVYNALINYKVEITD